MSIGQPLTNFNPYTIFHDFYNHPIIQKLAKQEMWTIASKDKIPHNIRAIHNSKGRIFPYATAHDNSQMMTLNDVTDTMRHARHITAWLDAPVQGYFCIDIEKTCPDELAADLIEQWKHIDETHIYREVSASGHGYHLVMPVPHDFDSHKLANIKVVKHPSTFFEVLFTHWTVFTRNIYRPHLHHPQHLQRPQAQNNTLNSEDQEFFRQPKTINEFLDYMTQYANLQAKQTVNIPHLNSTNHTPNTHAAREVHIDISSHTLRPEIAQIINQPYRNYSKTIHDFAGDTSRWEYGYLCHLAYWMDNNMDIFTNKHGYNYSQEERTIVLYEIAKQYLPPRAKHTQARGTSNYLMTQCASVIAHTRK